MGLLLSRWIIRFLYSKSSSKIIEKFDYVFIDVYTIIYWLDGAFTLSTDSLINQLENFCLLVGQDVAQKNGFVYIIFDGINKSRKYERTHVVSEKDVSRNRLICDELLKRLNSNLNGTNDVTFKGDWSVCGEADTKIKNYLHTFYMNHKLFLCISSDTDFMLLLTEFSDKNKDKNVFWTTPDHFVKKEKFTSPFTVLQCLGLILYGCDYYRHVKRLRGIDSYKKFCYLMTSLRQKKRILCPSNTPLNILQKIDPSVTRQCYKTLCNIYQYYAFSRPIH